LRQPTADQQRQCWKSRDCVVLLAGGKTKKKQDHDRPEQKKQVRVLLGLQARPQFPPSNRHSLQGLWQERNPGKKPQQQESPENHQRDGIVIAWHTLVQITQEMFIDEIEPEESVYDSLIRITQRRQNMPWRGDRKEDKGAGEEPHA